MTIRITPSVKAQVDRALRNAGYAGVLTAITPGGPVIVNDHHSAAQDTTNVWTTTVTGTGAISRTGGSATYGRNITKLNCPAGLDTAQIVHKATALTNPLGASATKDIYQKLVLEWEWAFNSVANIDNATFFMGIHVGTPKRDSPNVIGFILAADALNTLTKDGVSEVVTVVATPPTLTDINKFKIVLRNGAADFYVNGTLKNTHTANLLAGRLTIGWYVASEAAVAAFGELGAVRCYYDDVP